MHREARRILVAEDHDVTRHLLARSLATWDFEVITARDGEEAVSVLQGDDPPPLAVIDWMMPKLDGLEVCRRVRSTANKRYIYVVLLTARTQKQEVAAGLDGGADDYITKPFNPEELRARLKVGQRLVALERDLARKIRELESAMADVKKVKHLLPVCMYCKSVRDDKDYWREIEDYIRTETNSAISHGICPHCMEQLRSRALGT
ncbi:MAG: response regulator transcription factor [Verrucomicrobiota bacterium]|nr:response regulator transcription factor [Verrucomicrobiota bacterium]